MLTRELCRHVQQRGDKVIVFSDNIFALTKYAQALKKPLIYGGTSHAERTRVLHAFKHSPDVGLLARRRALARHLPISQSTGWCAGSICRHGGRASADCLGWARGGMRHQSLSESACA